MRRSNEPAASSTAVCIELTCDLYKTWNQLAIGCSIYGAQHHAVIVRNERDGLASCMAQSVPE